MLYCIVLYYTFFELSTINEANMLSVKKVGKKRSRVENNHTLNHTLMEFTLAGRSPLQSSDVTVRWRCSARRNDGTDRSVTAVGRALYCFAARYANCR